MLINGITWSRPLPGACIHPLLVKDLKIRAASANLDETERSKALTALAFVNTREAAIAMIELSKSTLADVSEQATYWVAFRQGNDWYSLIDWSKTGIDVERQRIIEDMKVKMSKILDERLPFNEKKWNAQDMARNAIGGQMLMGMVRRTNFRKNFIR